MIKNPPDWKEYLNSKLLGKVINSSELKELVKHANKKYIYWDTFKHYNFPDKITSKEAWAYLKFTRQLNSEPTPIIGVNKSSFTINLTKNMYKRLSLIDSNTSGFLTSDLEKPTNLQKSQLIMSGLTEEAIASSQIEGANTSRKVAKEMLLSNRKARTRDEQMIINNYQVMQRLMDWKDLQMSKSMLIDIQKNITSGTLDDENDSGRFRKDEDDIGVVDKLTGETVFTPPSENFVAKELDRMITYANSSESEDDFVHPVIKASILHFWLAYLHPFVDGNGRTARAIFYWYLLKSNYWMFQYLSVSRIIKRSKTKYDNSYLYTEHDDNDLTYFISYKLNVIEMSIKEFVEHYKRKIANEEALEKIASKLGEFNPRQVDLLQNLNDNKDKTIDLATYKGMYRVSYETARSDLLLLTEKNLLDKILSGKKYIYIPNTSEIKKILGIAKQNPESI